MNHSMRNYQWPSTVFPSRKALSKQERSSGTKRSLGKISGKSQRVPHVTLKREKKGSYKKDFVKPLIKNRPSMTKKRITKTYP